MILSINMLKRVGESRLVFLSDSNSYAAVEEDCTEVLDDSIRLVLMLYFFMVAHKAA